MELCGVLTWIGKQKTFCRELRTILSGCGMYAQVNKKCDLIWNYAKLNSYVDGHEILDLWPILLVIGKMIDRIDTRSAVRTCAFSFSGNMVAYSTDRAMGQQCVINVVDVRTFGNQGIVYKPDVVVRIWKTLNIIIGPIRLTYWSLQWYYCYML